MAASRSTEPRPSSARALRATSAACGGNERLAVVGVAVIVGSLLLPWYESPVSDDLVLTGLGGVRLGRGGAAS